MTGEQILRIFVIRRWWIIACLIIGTLMGIGLAFTLPRVYDAKSQVIVSVAEDSEVSAGESATYIDARLPTLLELSRSNDFAVEVAESAGVDRTVADVRSELVATVVPETTVVEIHARDSDPDRARILADRAAETLTRTEVTDRLGVDNDIDVSILQKAETDSTVVFPNPLRFLGFGALAGLVLGLLSAPIRHGLDRHVRDDADIAKLFDARLLAVRMTKPGRRIKREIASCGVATTIPGLLARLSVMGRSRGSVAIALCGVGGVGDEPASDIVETASANGMSCALVTADSKGLETARYRGLSHTGGSSVFDVSSGGDALSVCGHLDALAESLDHFDLVIFLTTDLAAHPETCGFLKLSDIALVVTPLGPERSSLRATQELLRANQCPVSGLVFVDSPLPPRASESRAVVVGYADETREATEVLATWFPFDAEAGSATEATSQDIELVTAPAHSADQNLSSSRSDRSHNTEGEQS